MNCLRKKEIDLERITPVMALLLRPTINYALRPVIQILKRS